MVILVGSWITHSTTATINEAEPDHSLAIVDGLALVNNANAQPVTPFFAPKSFASRSTSKALVTSTPFSPAEAHAHDHVNDLNYAKEFDQEAFTTVTHKVKKGQSLGNIFRDKSFDLAIPHYISKHEGAKALVSLKIGRELQFKLDKKNVLQQVVYPISSLQQLTVELDGQQVASATVSDLPYTTEQHSVSATINSSLYQTALDAGLSNNLIMEMVRIFGWDIDFVLDIRAGDSFHVLFTDHRLNGEKLSDGNILAAEFTTQGQTYRAIRFENSDGNASFYTPEGESMLGTFLRSPVEFSRISSRFGKRKHPISKRWKVHKGVDYAASRGTPVRATADGKVVHAGNKGGYGKTVVLRHAGRFSTLYAHMNGYAKKIRSGARVKQGQIIGYVGSTGYSTGPHLHYEFRVDGVHHNSLTYKTPKASSVESKFRTEFDQLAANLGKQLDGLQREYLIAQASDQNDKAVHTGKTSKTL